MFRRWCELQPTGGKREEIAVDDEFGYAVVKSENSRARVYRAEIRYNLTNKSLTRKMMASNRRPAGFRKPKRFPWYYPELVYPWTFQMSGPVYKWRKRTDTITATGFFFPGLRFVRALRRKAEFSFSYSSLRGKDETNSTKKTVGRTNTLFMGTLKIAKNGHGSPRTPTNRFRFPIVLLSRGYCSYRVFKPRHALHFNEARTYSYVRDGRR